MSHVFISYDRDDKAKIATIVEGLKVEQVEFWWDEKIPEGADFSTEIEDRIVQAQHVLVAWSANSRQSIFVKGEALAALDQQKLLQAVIDRCRLPVPFNAVQATFLDGWEGDPDDPRWRKLVNSIRGVSADEEPPTSTRRKVSKPPQSSQQLTEAQIVRAGASGSQLFSLWFIPILIAALIGFGAYLGFATPDWLPLRREDVFLVVGGAVVALLVVLVVMLVGVMWRAVSAVDPRSTMSSAEA